VRADHPNAAVEDTAPGRGALLHYVAELCDDASGAPLATVRQVQFLRGDGGCGAWGEAPPPCAPIDADAAAPWRAIDYPTTPQAALLYRQASRDLMPLHADPRIARAAGFERPISHGLNNLGLACRAVLKHHAPGRPERLRALSARFASPGYPGDTVRVELLDEGGGVLRFRARALERGVLLIDRGECRLDPA
jgi:acyl dehydratase